ncbi:hypothetical protein ParKJ_21960 [Paraburkholderia fungorum]|uniref:Uncharacterized protein n=1 Tax=Paraburkholderia fungorum TaxID=134537 RepID=A0AAP5QAM8_9BURK|nr:hypothetical protein [Paraburkholderia fungorum]MDT8840093.1 hypothetical protein [Paraburkholderia fungorum]
MTDTATGVWHLLQQVWPSLGVSAVVTPLIVWYVKWLIEQTHAKRLEAWRADLKKNADVELARLRAALDETAARRQALTNGLTQRRFDAIAATVAPLRRLYRAVQVYVSVTGEVGGANRDADRKAVQTAQAQMLEVLDAQSVFLSAETAAQVDAIRRLCEKAARLFLHTVDIAHDMPSGSDVNMWMQITQQIEGDAPLAILTLERDLRALMGDHETMHAGQLTAAQPDRPL